jgi:hypothetical protein
MSVIRTFFICEGEDAEAAVNDALVGAELVLHKDGAIFDHILNHGIPHRMGSSESKRDLKIGIDEMATYFHEHLDALLRAAKEAPSINNEDLRYHAHEVGAWAGPAVRLYWTANGMAIRGPVDLLEVTNKTRDEFFWWVIEIHFHY